MIDQNNKSQEVGSVFVPIIAIMFPLKLHRILDDAAEKGYEDIISWVPKNNGFKVHKTKLFESEIMPHYFNKTKYKSFQRQLNLWSYDRVTNGPDKGAYLHKHFIRGKPTLCNRMKRTKIKGIHSKTLMGKKVHKTTATRNNTTNSVNMSETKLWQAGVQKVADLERQKEEIQKQLNTASRELMIPRVPIKNNDYLTSLLSTTTSNLTSNSNLQHKQEQGQIIHCSNTTNRCTSLTFEEGDNTSFEGRNFFFVEESHVLELGCNNNKNKRSTSRSFSITLEDLDSDCDCDEYVLKELEEAIRLGTGIF